MKFIDFVSGPLVQMFCLSFIAGFSLMEAISGGSNTVLMVFIICFCIAEITDYIKQIFKGEKK